METCDPLTTVTLLAAWPRCPPSRDAPRRTWRTWPATPTTSSVPAHWPLIHQDTPADACYVILDGSAVVRIDGHDVATLGSGSIVGEVALATGRLRNATVTSVEPLDLLHLDVAQFRDLLDRRPSLRASLLARLTAATA